MSINDTPQDWSRIEQIAKQHEIKEEDHFLPVAKVPAPTIEQQLLWATIDLVKAKSSLKRKDSAISEALMYLSIGQYDRAQQVLSRGFLDL